MRAIITCKADVDLKELDGLLEKIGWWPALAQDHEEVVKRKNDILTHISDDDRVVAQETFVCVIYDEITRSWGIVSRPNKNALTFRIKNPISDRLKMACQMLVRNLQDMSNKKLHGEKAIQFEFNERIDVLERESVNYAFFGKILPPERWETVQEDKKNEIRLILWAFMAFLVILSMTIPNVVSSAKTLLPTLAQNGWIDFIKGLMDRIGSSAIVTAVVTALNVYFHYIDVSKISTIKWVLN